MKKFLARQNISSFILNAFLKPNKRMLIAFLFMLATLVLPLFAPLSLIAQQTDLEEVYEEGYQKLQENRAEQERLRQKIAEAQNQERTLVNQIDYLDNQIRLTELEINETQSEIITLQDQLLIVTSDIDKLKEKLGILTESIDLLDQTLAARVRASYEASFISEWEVFLASSELRDFILRYTYLKALQEEDKELLKQMKFTKKNCEIQKNEFEELKREKEELKTRLEEEKERLEAQEESLASQKGSKEYLLKITKNEEANFARLLAQTQAEQQAIQNAINEVLRKIAGQVLEGTRVERGEIIGIQGATGMATGAHLHFGYYPCGTWYCPADPEPLLGLGQLGWPMEDFRITQKFGLTEFALATGIYGYDEYGNPLPHNGFDMAGNVGVPIKAAHNGTVYYSVDGWGGHGAIIRDDSGFMTIYWHLQPR